MDNIMEVATIEDINVVLGTDINGACYITDRFGGLIGWYNYDLKVLNVDGRYKYIEKLLDNIEKHENIDFHINFTIIKDEAALKYFAKRRIKMKEKYEKNKKAIDYINENMKYIPSKRNYKKVKNAEQKIKKRHG
jgi:hypothetical protein